MPLVDTIFDNNNNNNTSICKAHNVSIRAESEAPDNVENNNDDNVETAKLHD